MPDQRLEGKLSLPEANPKSLSKQEVLALRGLRLPAAALKRLRQSGIYCEPAISIEHQHLARRYVIRGVESGGAVPEIGAYVGYTGINGGPLIWLQRCHAIARNGFHAVVVAPELARIQVFRNDRSYELLITGHRLRAVAGKNRPRLDNWVLFHGIHGTLAMKLWGKDKRSSGMVSPVFHARSGEPVLVPAEFDAAAKQVTAAVCCIGCRRPHLLEPGCTERQKGAG